MRILHSGKRVAAGSAPVRARGPLWLLLGAALMGLPLLGHSAPGDLSQVPLFLQQGVQPNIMLLMDDSGSMNWEILQRDTGNGSQGGYGFLDFTPNSPTKRLELCPGYNAMMYNPNETYTPWVGKDRYGNTYQNAQVTAAQENPFRAATSTSCSSGTNSGSDPNNGVCDLTTDMGPSGNGAYYFPWTDGDGDGLYDSGECNTSSGAEVWVSGMSAAQQQNFANWFSYYRKREYVVKRALSQIITESRERMGLATINRNTLLTDGGYDLRSEVGTEVADIDDISQPVNTQAQADKQRLLRNLFRVDSSNSTPLRSALRNVGRYFELGNGVGSSLFDYTPTNGSPILSAANGGECQQNFVIALSDGYWNGSFSGVFGNTDQDGPGPFDGQSYADGASDTLADIAMHYYERDLDTGLNNKVPKTKILPAGSYDDNPAQHLVTFTVAFGLNGNTACNPADRATSVASQGWPEVCTNPGFSGTGSGWPTPTSNAATTVDDMRHAAWNGRGQFLSAGDPQALIDQLQAAIADIAARTTASAAVVAVNSTNIQTGGLVYQAGFNSGQWYGELSAFNLLSGGSLGTPVWQAHTVLNNRSLGSNPRIMVTYNGTQGVPFQFPSDYQSLGSGDLAQGQVADLLFNAPNALGAPYDGGSPTSSEKLANMAFGQDLIDYLRGSSANEGTAPTDFRQRLGNRLADIIHSGPVYVGNPDGSIYPDNIEGGGVNSYQTWANVTAFGRTPMLYVGTNGGGLHGFDATTGDELFAFFPRNVFSSAAGQGLHWLAEQNYEHRYYTDQTPSVGEVHIDTGDGNGKTWRTILVGGLRGGGKSVFALDVSDSSVFSTEAGAASQVLWEFTDNDLGYTFSQPTLAKLNNGKWAAIFGNGYNTDPNGDGAAKLFILYLDGSNLSSPIILNTKAGSMANSDCKDVASDCNGLATPAVIDLGGDGIADRVYVGDLKGNLWVFDLSNASASNWGPAFGSIASPLPLFTATVGGVPQPITSQPAVTLHPTEKGLLTEPNTMVFFGTGQFLADGDTALTGTQSFYGIWDGGARITGNRSDLVQQTITQTTQTVGGSTFDVRVISDNLVNYSVKKGWFLDLPTAKERVIVNPLLFGDLVVFTTTIPDNNLCGSAGTSWLMALDFFNGGEPDFIAIDIDNNGTFDSNDVVGGHNAGGVKSGDLYWQPTIVQSGTGAQGTILLPKDNSSGSGSTLETRSIQGGSQTSARSSWTRFSF